MDEIVKFKGTGDGVKVYLSQLCDFSEIIKELYSKLDAYRRFFGNGRCNIYFIGREISISDKIRLEAVVKTMLPEVVVNYGEKKLFRRIKANENQVLVQKPYVPNMKEVTLNNFKSNRARFFEGVVKSGKSVESDSHMLLVGDVMEDGEVYAAGNIVIFGRLMGKAYAGTNGSKEAYILAMDFCPQIISIAGVEKTGVEYDIFMSKRAKLINNEIFIEEFLLNI